MTHAELRTLLAGLGECARAFDRAQRKGYVLWDDESGYMEADTLQPAPSENPDQLPLI